MTATWRIELLGGLKVQTTQRRVAHFRTRGAGWVLARLALAGAPTRRDALVEWLWPDSGFEAGRNRLSVALSALRRELFVAGAPPLLVANHDLVGLNFGEVQTDVAAFEDALKLADHARGDELSQALEGALSLFAGPLLPGFDDEWFAAHARRLSDEFAGAAARLAGLSPGQALPFLRRGREFNPAREDVARTLLRVLTQGGQLDEARRELRELEATLRRDWNRAPSVETRTLAQALLQTGAATEATVVTKGLPPAPNRFFGRESELNLLRAWLRPAGGMRLVTIWGGAGRGKTRLALEAARSVALEFDGNAFFVPLGNVTSPGQLWEALAGALKVPRVGELARAGVLATLKRRRTLLVLDGFEHLLEWGTDEVQLLLEGAPTTVLLVTSRRTLNREDERLLALAPLPLPRLDEEGEAPLSPLAASLDEWAHNPAVRLFFDRARLASPAFRLHTGNARDVAHVCRALEGVPLAIELAAARTLALSPAQVRAHLSERLDFLSHPETASEEDNTHGHHASLRATLDWSFELLSPDARSTLRRLSVFRGGWTLPVATAVCTPRNSPGAARRILEAHEELRRHALLDGEEVGGEMRFRLAASVREYALERARSDEDARTRRALRRRHALEFARLAETFARCGRERTNGGWFARLERDLFNLREALDWALEHDGALALRLTGCLWWFWFGSSRLSEGRAALERAFEAAKNTTRAGESHANWRAEAHSGAGFLAWRQGDLNAARAHGTQGLCLAREASEGYALIYSLLVLMLTATVQGDFDTAKAQGDECLSLCRARGDQHGQAFALHLLGGIAEMTGDARTAWTRQEQSCALFEATGSSEGQAWGLCNWGIAARRLGDWERSLALCKASRALFEQLGSREGAAYCDLHTGLALEGFACLGEDRALVQGASECLRRALNEFWRLNVLWGLALSLEGMALVAGRSDACRATRLWSAAQGVRERIGTPVPPADRETCAAVEARLLASLGELSFDAHWQLGRDLTLEQIVRDANRNS